MSTIAWTGATGGRWATGANWSPAWAVPGASDDVVITEPGIYRITQSQAESVNSVLLDAPGAVLEIEAPLTVAGAFTLDAGEVLFNGGTVDAGSFTMNGGLLTGPTVDINAVNTIAFPGGRIVANDVLVHAASYKIGSVPLAALPGYAVATQTLPTNWTQTVPFAQFSAIPDPLTAINLDLTADVVGNVSVENLDGSGSAVSVTLPDYVTIGGPSGEGLAELSANNGASTVNLGAFDGTINYNGPSGTTVGESNDATSSSIIQLDSAEVAAFTGNGTIDLPVSVIASLHVTGSANLQISAQASASVVASLQYLSRAPGAGDTFGGGSSVTLTPHSGTLGFANSSTTAPQVFTFADQTTGWNHSFSINPFNPALGKLEAVNVTVTGDILASVAAENDDNTPATVSTTQVATVAVSLPDGTAVTTDPTVHETVFLGAFDGSDDYAGTSGQIDQGLTQTTTTVAQLTGSADMAAFLGGGTVEASISDMGTGTLDGPANMMARLLAQSGATVTVSYTYLARPTDSWINTAGGDWATAANWSSASTVPAAGDNVSITLPGTYRLTASTAETVHSLLLDSPDAVLVLDAPLDVTGIFTLDAGTVVFDGGSLSVGSFDQNGGLVTGNGVDILASGTIDFAGGQIGTGPDGTFVAQALAIRSGTTSFGPTSPAMPLQLGGTSLELQDNGVLVVAASPDAFPVLSGITISGNASYAAGSVAMALDPGLTISDPNSSMLTSATVSIGAGFLNGDTLSLGEAGTITSSYDAAKGVLSLTGTASLLAYQTALESVSYAFSPGDPTAGGTDTSRAISWSINDGITTPAAISTGSLAISFTSNPNADTLLQNTTGQLALWQLSGTVIDAGGYVGPSPGPAWTAVATGAFFSGDRSDIAFQNQNGTVALWQVQGTTLLGGGVLSADPGPNWHMRGTGDFYGDGNTDILLQNDNGQVALWDMNGTVIAQGGQVAINPGTSWRIAGTGDFYGDGNSDILWQNNNGEAAVWEMNGTTVVQGARWRTLVRTGTSLAAGISTTTARPTSCCRTITGRFRSGT